MKVDYVPDVETLLTDLMPALWTGRTLDDVELVTRDVINTLLGMGYTISREVEVTGPLEDTLRAIDDGSASRNAVRRGRPVRHEEREKENE